MRTVWGTIAPLGVRTNSTVVPTRAKPAGAATPSTRKSRLPGTSPAPGGPGGPARSTSTFTATLAALVDGHAPLETVRWYVVVSAGDANVVQDVGSLSPVAGVHVHWDAPEPTSRVRAPGVTVPPPVAAAVGGVHGWSKKASSRTATLLAFVAVDWRMSEARRKPAAVGRSTIGSSTVSPGCTVKSPGASSTKSP